MSDLVQQLREEAVRLSGHAIDRGSADAGIAANLADAAADRIESLEAAASAEPVALWRTGEWGDGSTLAGRAVIFCDEHETAIASDVPAEAAATIVDAHNAAYLHPTTEQTGARSGVREALQNLTKDVRTWLHTHYGTSSPAWAVESLNAAEAALSPAAPDPTPVDDDISRVYEDHEPTASGGGEAGERLYDADAYMADGEIEMTAAEAVLAHLLINVIGVVDDQNYTPNQAQALIEPKLRDLSAIEDMLCAGQGDDEGPQILPDFEPGTSLPGMVEACLHLLERRRDVIDATLSRPTERAVSEAELIAEAERVGPLFVEDIQLLFAREAAAALAQEGK